MSLEALYRELIMDHYRAPRGRTPLERVDREASGSNPVCGDVATLRLSLEGERIAGVQVEAAGCAISIASGSLLAEVLEGRSMNEARGLALALKDALTGKSTHNGTAQEGGLGDLEALAGVRNFPMRVKCALLPWVVLLEDLLAPEGQGEQSGGL